MKITPKRQTILDALQKQTSTVSARTLASEISHVDQATVYRNLDLFVKNGLVNKYVFDGSESVYEYAKPDHHHAVCTECDRVIHIHAPDQPILDLLGIGDFSVQSLQVTARGVCAKKHQHK